MDLLIQQGSKNQLMKNKISVLIVFALLAIHASAQPAGAFDPSFNAIGYRIEGTGTSDDAYATAVQIMADGRIVVAGISEGAILREFRVHRYLPNGDLDTSFAQMGIVQLAGMSLVDNYIHVALQADEKILVVGTTDQGGNYGVVLGLLNVDGTMDSTFGTAGWVVDQDSSYGQGGVKVFVQADGRILVASTAYDAFNQTIQCLRYMPDGSKDLSYGINGRAIAPLPQNNSGTISAKLQSDGKILIAGYVDSAFYHKPVVVRFDTSGNPDNSFGNGSIATLALNAFSNDLMDMALGTAGELYLCGNAFGTPGYEKIAVRKLDAMGVEDTSYGLGGVALLGLGGTDCYPAGIATNAAGQVVVTGDSEGLQISFLVGRLNADGSLDASFGGNGVTAAPLGNSLSLAFAVAIQADGKIIAVGDGAIGSQPPLSFAIARYLGSPFVAVEPSAPQLGLTIFPNPASAYATLRLPFDDVSSLQIFDMQGRPMAISHGMEKLRDAEYLVDVSEFAAGIYWVVARSATQSSTMRLAVVHSR